MAYEWIPLGVVVDGRWRPGIGDPTLVGWLTVGAYFAATVGCARAARRRSSPGPHGRNRPDLFWATLAVLMAVLGVNKQLDLQSLLTVIGRGLFQDLGLYGERRRYQVAFIRAVALLCAGAFAASLWLSRHALRERGPALAGMVLLLAFVVIRACSFHNVDLFISSRIVGLKWNWVLELGEIGAIGLASFRIRPAVAPPPTRDGNHAVYRFYARIGGED